MKKYLVTRLQSINGIKIFPSVTNFSRSAPLNMGIIIRDCFNFKGPDSRYIRAAVKNRKENSKLVQAIKKVMSESE